MRNSLMQVSHSIQELTPLSLNGAFVGYGVDYANLGQKTADMIADILMNDADPATTSVETF